MDRAIVALGQRADDRDAWPDALVAGPAATHLGGILLLVDPDDLSNSAATRDHLVEHADEIATATIVGGPLAISDAVRDQVLDAIDG